MRLKYTDEGARDNRIFLDGREIFDATEVDDAEGLVWRRTYSRRGSVDTNIRDNQGNKIYLYAGKVEIKKKEGAIK